MTAEQFIKSLTPEQLEAFRAIIAEKDAANGQQNLELVEAKRVEIEGLKATHEEALRNAAATADVLAKEIHERDKPERQKKAEALQSQIAAMQTELEELQK